MLSSLTDNAISIILLLLLYVLDRYMMSLWEGPITETNKEETNQGEF